MTFNGNSSASLIIEGKIAAAGGVLALISEQIYQKGSLHANEVFLLAGREVQLGQNFAKIVAPVGSCRKFWKAFHGRSKQHDFRTRPASSPLRLFTAYSQAFTAGPGINFVDIDPALLKGVNPATLGYPGTIGVNTAIEQWCTFFGCPSNYPFPNLGVPFTFFYKVCVPVLAQQAQIIVTEFLLDLHPSNEFPGWMEEFWVEYSKTPSRKDPTRVNSLTVLDNEPFYSRRRHLNVINHPKTWTSWFE